jgi:F-type H+-transporting ATPase subunit delta
VADTGIESYARAIVDVATAEGVLPAVEDELFRFARTLEREHELRNALSDLALPADRKGRVVDDLLGDKATPTTTALVHFLVAQGRVRELPAIADRFVEMAAASREAVVAEVRSAVPLPDDVTERLTAALSRKTGKRVTVKVVIDPDVIGGIVATVGDLVIDGSIRHRLEVLREQIA